MKPLQNLIFIITINLIFLSFAQAAEKEDFYSGKTYIQLPQKDPRAPFDENDPRWREWNRRGKEDRDWEWKMPINFYGKVIDENGRPVEKANINLDWNDTSKEGTSFAKTVSDANGLFSLSGVKGKILGVKPKKEGYYTSLKQNRFGFEYAAFFAENYHIPDSNNPVIFYLRKRGESEPLLYRDWLVGFKPDNTLYSIDLIKKMKSLGNNPSGDLLIHFNRGQKNEKGKFDWTLELQAIDGGLIETEEEFMFLAPEDGYKSTIQYEQKAVDEKYQASFEKKYYLKSRGGKNYTRIVANIYPGYDDEAAIRFEYYLNPNGSRNLEFDSAKALPGSD